MSDVAALARVSLTTVSRVINGVATVDEELAARVHRAAAALDFRPNLTASSLRRRGGRTRTIGLLLENVANPFSSALYRAVEDVARGWGVGVLAGSVDEEPARERELVLDMVARRVDGLIIVPTGDDQSYLINERRAGVSVVFADRPPKQLKADSVASDNHNGALLATKHLVAGGHRRIGYLGDLVSIQTSADRMAGYVDGLRECGIAEDAAMMRSDLHSIEAAEDAALSLLRDGDPPTAFFAAQNLVTIGAMRALRTLGLQTQVALVGFDNFPLADLLEPAVTVVAQDPSAIGEIAAEILFRRMDGDESPPRDYVVPTQLIVRGSGEILARS